jgi:hypothetical protein
MFIGGRNRRLSTDIVVGRLAFRRTLWNLILGADMVREEARRTLLREYDKWAKDHPDDASKRGGVVFFTYLQKERTDLLDFHAVGGDKWATVHGWLYYTGRVRD